MKKKREAHTHTKGVLEGAKTVSVEHNRSNNSNRKQQQHNISGGHHLYSNPLQ